MSCHKCPRSKHSKIPSHRQRYIPTFVHEDIFNYSPNSQGDSYKCSPTFHSTVLNTEGYQIKTIHQQPKHLSRPCTATKSGITTKSRVQQVCDNVIYKNDSRVKRVDALNPHNHNCQQMAMTSSRNNWFDHTKEDIIGSLGSCQKHGYSKERKIVDLSSDPVFTDYVYGKDKPVRKSSNSNRQSNRVNNPSNKNCNNPYCKCGSNCKCGDNCQCGIKYQCAANCQCGANCECGEYCQCPNCLRFSEKQCSNPHCKCGQNCQCSNCYQTSKPQLALCVDPANQVCENYPQQLQQQRNSCCSSQKKGKQLKNKIKGKHIQICEQCGPKCQCGSACQCGPGCRCCGQPQTQINNLVQKVNLDQKKVNGKKPELKLKGNKVAKRPDSAKKTKVVCQKPTFTVTKNTRINNK